MFLSALIIGLLGSLHCIAMCSPITLMLGKSSNSTNFLIQRVLYNVGRLVGYATLGLVAGVLGRLINFAGIQQWFSIGIGIGLLVMVLLFNSNAIYNPSFKPLQTLVVYLRSRFSHIYSSQSKFKGLFIGILNGFLPCGLVYMAIIGAVTMNSLFDSIIYMVVFGIGTWPMMLLASFSSGWITKKVGVGFLKVVPIVLALLFIVRGLGLGIPYVSPEFNETSLQNGVVECAPDSK